jgi:hypothetical protein
MALFSRLLGRTGWSLEGVSLPWQSGETSIYDHSRAQVLAWPAWREKIAQAVSRGEAGDRSAFAVADRIRT